jgi:hypothetical protein
MLARDHAVVRCRQAVNGMTLQQFKNAELLK